MPERVRALPPVLGHGLDARDPLAVLERDLIVLARVVATHHQTRVNGCEPEKGKGQGETTYS